jgi:hypothetical protein
MNRPFTNDFDTKHILAAREFVKPGHHVLAICLEGPFSRQDAAAREFHARPEEIGVDMVTLSRDGTSSADPGRRQRPPAPNFRLIAI